MQLQLLVNFLANRGLAPCLWEGDLSKTYKSYLSIEAEATKDGKDVKIKVTNEVHWDNDYSDSTCFFSLSELFYEAEKKGFEIKKETMELRQRDVKVPELKEPVQEKVQSKEETKTETTTKKNRWGIK